MKLHILLLPGALVTANNLLPALCTNPDSLLMFLERLKEKTLRIISREASDPPRCGKAPLLLRHLEGINTQASALI